MADAEITFTPDGERALREAERFCYKANVAILAPEHLLGGALLVLAKKKGVHLFSEAVIEEAIGDTQGAGSDQLEAKVMWGSAARDALTMTAAALRSEGGTQLSAAVIARGVIESGEVSPMFFASLGTTKAALLAALVE